LQGGGRSAIGINFEGGANGGAPTALKTTDVAGVVPETNWNNAAGANSTADLSLNDSTGTASGVSASWTSPDVWGTPQTLSNGDDKLMNGYIDSSNATPNVLHNVDINNIPYANYTVYAYVGADTNGRTGTGTLVASGGGGVIGFTTEDVPLALPYNINKDTSGATFPKVDVLEFDNVSGSSIVYQGGPGGTAAGNVGLHGIEIVDNPTAAPAVGPSVTLTGGPGQINLTWNYVDASSYSVYRGTTPGGEAATPIAKGLTGTSFTDNVTGTATYYYTVSADNSFGSTPSAEVSGTSNASTIPQPPTNVTSTGSPTGISLAWSPSTFAASYNVKRSSVTGGPYTTVNTAPITGTTFTDTTAAVGTFYYYVVTAVDSAGESGPSTEITAAAPVIGTGEGWQASWYSSSVANQNTYFGDQTANVLLTNPDGNPLTNNAVPGVVQSNTPSNSAVLGFQRIESGPINYTGFNDANSPPNAPASYNTIETIGPGHDIAATYIGYVEPELTGYYTLLPKSDDGNSITYLDPSTSKWITLAPNNILTPQGPTTAIVPIKDSTGAPVLWTAGQKYEIQFNYNNFGGGWEADLSWEASSVSGTAGTNDIVAPSLIPTSQVSPPAPAFSTFDAFTANTGLTNGLAKDQSYYNLNLAGNSGQIMLVFGNIAADNYNIYRTSQPTTNTTPPPLTAYTLLTNVPATKGAQVTYTDTGLASGTTYYYLVTAINSAGTTPMANGLMASGTTVPQPPAFSPTNVQAVESINSAGKPQNALTFNSVQFATGYTVQRSTSATGPFTTISGATPITGTSYVDADPALSLTQNYYYQILANNSASTVDKGFGPGNSAPSTPPALGGFLTGVEVHGYNNEWWSSPTQTTAGYENPSLNYNVVNIAPNVNQDGNDTLPTLPTTGGNGAFGLQADNFSVIESGKVTITTAGTYQFSAQTDDDGYLVVDGTVVSQNPGGHGVQAPVAIDQVPLTLTPGSYNFQFYESNGGGGWGIHMHWSATDANGAVIIPDQTVPQTALISQEDAPAAPTFDTANGEGAGTPTLNADNATYTVPITFTDNSVSELNYILQRSTSATFASGTVQTLAPASRGYVDNTSTGAPVSGVVMNDPSAPPNSTLYYRIVASNFDGTGTSPIVTATTGPVGAAQPGIEAHFYQNEWWRSTDQSTNAPASAGASLEADLNTLDPNINEESTATATFPTEAPGIGPNNFSDVFTGKLTVTTAGNYQFQTWSDDDSYVYVDGVLASASPGGHGIQAPSYTAPAMNLTAGTHDVVYFHSNGGGGWGYNLEYSGPDNANAAFGNPTVPATAAALVPGTVLTSRSDPVTTPVLTTAAGNGNSVVLTWNTQPSVVSYVLERSSKSFSDPTLTAADITTIPLGIRTSYNDIGLNYAATYHYRLMAQNFDSASLFTGDTTGTAGNTLAAPTGISSYQCDNTEEVFFTAPALAPGGTITGYTIERSTDGGTTFTPAGTAPASATSFTDTGPAGGFTPGSSYVYRVTAQGTPGNSIASTNTTTGFQTIVPNNHANGFGVTLAGVQTDGGFELPNAGYVSTQPGAYAYNPTGGAWTFNGSTGQIATPSAFGSPAAVEGQQVAFLQSAIAAGATDTTNLTFGQNISQGMTFAAGSYIFHDYDVARGGNNAASYEVALDYTPSATPPTAAQIIFTSNPAQGNFKAESSAPFTVTAGSHTITLIATGPEVAGQDNTSFIDAVQITPATTAPVGFDMQMNGDAVVVPPAATDPAGSTGRLELTHAVNSQASSAYERVATNVGNGFTTTFDFQFSGGTRSPADGIAFILQEAGPTALGGGGGSLGVSGIPGKSAGIYFNTYNASQTGLDQNGNRVTATDLSTASALGANVFGNYPTTGSSDMFQATLAYDATNKVVHETVVDTTTSKAFTQDYPGIDLTQVLGSNCAYLGFTGGTGGANETADIVKWTFTPTTVTSVAPTVASTIVGDGTAQRSEVRNFTVAFNEPVTLAPGAITLALLNTTGSGSGTNDGAAPTDESTGLTWASTDGGKTYVVTFSANTDS
ncbi:MAG TPA: PA14 domain-containing protein, partial [Tepidisphaeraceae bacterium]|nr:PA14 domain-containing protein [Tepidisphaeraceae bacterium]